jgi:hypothetical protein
MLAVTLPVMFAAARDESLRDLLRGGTNELQRRAPTWLRQQPEGYLPEETINTLLAVAAPHVGGWAFERFCVVELHRDQGTQAAEIKRTFGKRRGARRHARALIDDGTPVGRLFIVGRDCDTNALKIAAPTGPWLYQQPSQPVRTSPTSRSAGR